MKIRESVFERGGRSELRPLSTVRAGVCRLAAADVSSLARRFFLLWRAESWYITRGMSEVCAWKKWSDLTEYRRVEGAEKVVLWF